MRCCIIYFSQTGNTRQVAETIQETLAALTGSCALVRLEDADPMLVERYDLIGLGAPAFYFREPYNVQKFLEELPDHSSRPRPFFFFVTHGGTPGAIAPSICGLAARQGFVTLDFYQCLGYDTYPPFASRVPASGAGHPDQQDLDRAKAFAESVLIKARLFAEDPQANTCSLPGGFLNRTVAGMFSHRALLRHMRTGLLPRKNIKNDLCTKCGLCVEQCPANVITLEPYPVFREDDCIACYQCERICPERAYKNNWVPFKLLTGEYLYQFASKIFHGQKNSKP
ncbi:4Fe-4S binding protein [candidate division TA06 bacterium]|uniref:4Fe-4S binding protein n=1 Tax=candidate division TA06 bacterium TaxID=2250710 RepID=A0A933ICE5_UNCT6|nr:4Fe-4S binding protein [candidate division TA06 bacterium]